MAKDGPIFRAPKIWKHPVHLGMYMAGQIPPPVTAELDLTMACNHRCPDCAGGRDGAVRMGNQDADRIIRQMAAFGVKGVMFTGGGEPLVHTACIEMMALAKSLGMDVGLISNGALLTPAVAARVVPLCTWIRVSIDAATPEMHERTHGVKGQFLKVLANTKSLAAIARELASECTVGTAFLTSNETKGDMVKLAELLHDTGVDYLHFRPYYNNDDPVGEEIAACRKFENDRFEITTAHRYGRVDRARQYEYCHGSHFAAVVQADLHMPLCCNLRGRPEYYIGSLAQESFADIWRGERKLAILKGLNVHQCLPACRCDLINEQIEQVLKPIRHENFL